MTKYRFKAKDIKTGEYVEGDLVYAKRVCESPGVKPMIVKHYIHGGCAYIGERHFIDENTLELIKYED